ncbi:uncharacterized protein EDB93DRAFT_1301477 [Suillus bovinus]|uniref:uncharacterized protein n=1 Tax=Suillus bovinus TaxID=48563 RepID=UPI001B85BE5A|nr:uncharacterized protein EDB93DRAFT_1301477 [Suillus bovinus]KAG2137846.1 hypothetical protein EDB93DRAFT_1301477 [Suillus bovinus]
MATLAVSSHLPVHGITIDFTRSRTNIESAEVRIGRSSSQIQRDAGKSFQQKFSPPMVLSHRDSFSLHIQYKKCFVTKIKNINLKTGDMFRMYSENEEQEYVELHKKIRIIVALSEAELRSTSSDIFQKCPRFRILVIGKSGVGKSSLISYAFGVEKNIISENQPGAADIEKELKSPQNKRFVLHDSKGFEAGDRYNLEIVRDFIVRRKGMSPEHQLHAIWFCFEIPRAGGPFLENGAEEFLEWKRSGILGDVPVIIVFTKYDMLIDRMERTLAQTTLDGSDDEVIKKHARDEAKAELQNICVGPLQALPGPDIPYAAVSAEEDFRGTLSDLVEKTKHCIDQHSAPDSEAAVMSSVAQRVHPGLNIDASIKVGKKRYWKSLASCALFKNHQMVHCLDVLHTDIVDVWNFYDPQSHLHGTNFKGMMRKMVNDTTAERTRANPIQNIGSWLSVVGAIAGIVAAVAAAGPAAPIAAPIAAGAVLAVYVGQVYQTCRAAIQSSMAYIAHLTLVLQTLYLLSESQALTLRAIELAFKAYDASPMKEEVFTWIQDYVTSLTALDVADEDIMEKVIEVIQFYKIDAAQVSKLREQIPHVDLSAPDGS